MENQQEHQRDVRQTDLVLNMTCSTRNQLITGLNDLSAILKCNKPIPEDAKERIRKKIDNLERLLTGLLPFGPIKSSSDAPVVFEEMVPVQLIVALSKAERLNVVGHLMAVREAVSFDSLTTCETKRDLVTEAKRIIHRLIDLPSLPDQEQSNESGEENCELLLAKQMGR